MKKNYYLAYGSNLNLDVMKARCPSARAVSYGVLNGYRLAYRGSAAGFSYLTIEKAEGYQVPVGIFKIASFDIPRLDYCEGYPTLYGKDFISIKAGLRKYKGLIYVMKENFSYQIPSSEYVATCEVGSEYFGFDKSILDEALD